MRSAVFAFVLSLCFITSIASAKTVPSSWCGTHGLSRTTYALQMHQRHKKDLALESLATFGVSEDVGEIAVIEGDSNTIISPNLFDLGGRKVVFVERAS